MRLCWPSPRVLAMPPALLFQLTAATARLTTANNAVRLLCLHSMLITKMSLCVCVCVSVCVCVCVSVCVCVCQVEEANEKTQHSHSHPLTYSHSLTHTHSLFCFASPDDGNRFNGDGCNSLCFVEEGFSCVTTPLGSTCTPLEPNYCDAARPYVL